jgi:phosphohistidine phosphatase
MRGAAMTKRIVLVRHGQAEPARPMTGDAGRRLTPRGRQMLERAYPEAFAQLAADGDPIEIWASSSARTRQTAGMVASALGISEDDVFLSASLTRQDASRVAEELLACEHTVVAVGHEPSIGAVASELSGRMRILARGEALCLDASGGRRPMDVLWDCVPR